MAGRGREGGVGPRCIAVTIDPFSDGGVRLNSCRGRLRGEGATLRRRLEDEVEGSVRELAYLARGGVAYVVTIAVLTMGVGRALRPEFQDWVVGNM
jgi:hypothetical protein